MENFSLEKIDQLSREEGKKYLLKYFTPLTNGDHAQLIDGKYEIINDKVLKNVYFKRISSDITNYYNKEYNQVRTLVYELNKPEKYDEKLNLCPKMKHTYKEYKTFTEEVRDKVDIMLNFLKEVWSNGNEDVYTHIIKYLANMVKGNKNDCCMYLKGAQGLGKSTFPQFLMKHVIGNALCLETGSEPIKSRFNSILGGKLFVVFEELENFSTGDWQLVSTRLKRYITSNLITLEKKGMDAYESNNMNNYMILSNNDAIKDDDGRRYFILDLSTKRIGDTVFFDNVYNNCFTDEVGEAFYSYLLEVNTDNFHPQQFPTTKSKQDACVKRLDSVYAFIKETYILERKSFQAILGEVYLEYKLFCANESQKSYCKIDFSKKLDEVKIIKYKSGSVYKFNTSFDLLLQIFKKNRWMHELDEFKPTKKQSQSDLDNDLDNDIDNVDIISALDHGIPSENDILKAEIELLKKQLEENKINKPKTKTKTKKTKTDVSMLLDQMNL